MSKKNVAQSLEAAKEQLKGKNIVAFLGESYCGKTVVSALLKFTISNYFVPSSKGEFEATVTKGNTVITNIIKKMHAGFFPPHTLPYHKSPLMIDIYTTHGFGGKVELILRDMSGEDYEEYLITEYDNSDDRLADLVTEGKTDSDTFGPLSHLIFAKMYVILIDCSKFSDWKIEQANYANMISALKQLKEKIEETVDGKFISPLAFVFTKADLLPEGERKKQPSELIKYMPELVSNLHIYHKGSVEYFLVNVDVENATSEDIALMAKEETEDKTLTEQTIQDRLNQVSNKAKQTALQSGMDEQQATAHAEQVKQAEIKKIEEEKKQLSNLPKQTFKLKSPFTYTHSEYIRFISWVIERLLSK